jgi:hypothetical protein
MKFCEFVSKYSNTGFNRLGISMGIHILPVKAGDAKPPALQLLRGSLQSTSKFIIHNSEKHRAGDIFPKLFLQSPENPSVHS